MKNILLAVAVIGLTVVSTAAQRTAAVPTVTELQKLVSTEKEFARVASEKGTKSAFLTYLADDGIVFNPTEVNGRLLWKNRPESPALLAWNPVWADISSNGTLGYTTGGWEYRAKGKTDRPTVFGEYVTIWQKQSDGQFRAVLDIGIKHPQNNFSNAAWSSPSDAGRGNGNNNGIGDDTLTDIFSDTSMANGYFNYLAEDAIILRDGELPFSGRKTGFIGLESLEKRFPDSSFLRFNANKSKIFGNMMYAWGVYSLTHKDKTVDRWNFVQIWKYRSGKWQIVLDVFSKIEKN